MADKYALQRPWGTLSYVSAGGGTPLILLHAIGRNHSYFSNIIIELEKHFRCICPDLCGHGASTVPRTPVTIKSMADDVIALITEGYFGKCALVGHGMGGMVALEVLRLQANLVGKIMLLDTFLPGILQTKLYDEEIIPFHDYQRIMDFRRELARWVATVRDGLIIEIGNFRARQILDYSMHEVIFAYGDRGRGQIPPEKLLIPRRHNFDLYWITGGTHFFPHDMPMATAYLITNCCANNNEQHQNSPNKPPLPPPDLNDLILFGDMMR